MIAWEDRPSEIACLFNPAFCGMLIREVISSYVYERGVGLPFTLSFLILPIILHEDTRLALPGKASVSMLEWKDNNPQVFCEFASRAKRLVPFTKEAIIFCAQKRILSFDREMRLRVVGISEKPKNWPEKSEPSDCFNHSRFLGRWFASTGGSAEIYKIWGVRP